MPTPDHYYPLLYAAEVSSDPRVVEVYLGTDAGATQAAAAQARR